MNDWRLLFVVEESPTQTASAGSFDQVEIDDEDEEEEKKPAAKKPDAKKEKAVAEATIWEYAPKLDFDTFRDYYMLDHIFKGLICVDIYS